MVPRGSGVVSLKTKQYKTMFSVDWGSVGDCMCLPDDTRVCLLSTLNGDSSYVGPTCSKGTVDEPKAQWEREVGASVGHSLQPGPLDTGPTAGHSSQHVLWVGRKETEKKMKAEANGCIDGSRRGTPATQVPVSYSHRSCCPRGPAGEAPEEGVRLLGLRSPGLSPSPGSE